MNIGIMSGGSADLNFIFEYLEDHDYGYWIGVDSGLRALKRAGIVPNLAVGDFDSVDEKTLAFFRSIDRIEWDIHPSEKDESDLELAIMRACELKPEKITVFACTGTRMDHMLASLSDMKFALDEGISLEYADPWQRMYLIGPGDTYIRRDELFGPFVSFIAMGGPACGVTLEGFKYEVDDFDVSPWRSRTLSNEPATDAETMHVYIREGYLLCIEATDAGYHND